MSISAIQESNSAQGRHAISFDIEDYYQVGAFQKTIAAADWPAFESRVVQNTDKILRILDDHKVHATFFILGCIAERFPELVKAIQEGNHEVACHGYAHEMITKLNPELFRQDVRKAKSILENLTGTPILGYRAPSFTITVETLWALEILVEEGFLYDSSIFPTWHFQYGIRHASPDVHLVSTKAGRICEIPPSTVMLAGVRVPVAGGGYFRLWPYLFTRYCLKKLEREGRQLVMYFHPWELDPAQPRLMGSFLSRFRHYLNLERTEERLNSLLRDFSFGTIRSVIAPVTNAGIEGYWDSYREMRNYELVRGKC